MLSVLDSLVLRLIGSRVQDLGRIVVRIWDFGFRAYWLSCGSLIMTGLSLPAPREPTAKAQAKAMTLQRVFSVACMDGVGFGMEGPLHALTLI